MNKTVIMSCMFKRATLGGLFMTTMLAMSGCAEKTPPKEAVKKRALERWSIRQSGKIDGLYEYLSPAKRQIVSRASYERQFGMVVEYSDAEIQNIHCNDENKPEVCKVTLGVTARLKTGSYAPAKNKIIETWVLENGEWWFSPK